VALREILVFSNTINILYINSKIFKKKKRLSGFYYHVIYKLYHKPYVEISIC